MVISEGIWTVENLNSIPQIGVLSKEDILNSRTSPSIDYSSADNIYGGDFIGKLRSFGKKALAGIKTALPYVKDVATTVAPFLPLLGLGEENHEGGVMVGGDYVGGRKKKGGRMISRKELHDRLY